MKLKATDNNFVIHKGYAKISHTSKPHKMFYIVVYDKLYYMTYED